MYLYSKRDRYNIISIYDEPYFDIDELEMTLKNQNTISDY
jgi:hypothetical protein